MYSGFVKATTRCEHKGTWYNPGAVFEVSNIELWSDDPFKAVEVEWIPDVPPRMVTRPIAASVLDARRRPLDPTATGYREAVIGGSVGSSF